MANESVAQRYRAQAGLNGTALLVQGLLMLAGVGLGFAKFQRGGGAAPVWYSLLAAVVAVVAVVVVVLAVGVYRRRPPAVHAAGGWYMLLAAGACVYSIAAFLVVEDLTLRVLLGLSGALGAGLAFVLLWAISKQIESDNAHAARLLWYGARVELAVLLVLAIVAMVNYAARVKYVRADWTAGGAHSLSPRSKQLVANLKEPIRLTSLYAILEDVPQSARVKEYLEAVKELFDEYQRVNPRKIEIEQINPIKDRDKVARLLARLKKIYQPEAGEHIKIIEQFRNEQIEQFRQTLGAERDQAKELQPQAKGGQLADLLGQAVSAFDEMVQRLHRVERTIEAVRSSDLPRYTDATNAIRDYCQQVKRLVDSAIKAYGEVEGKAGSLSEPMRTFLRQGRSRLGGLLSRCTSLIEKINGLESLKSETLPFDLRQQNPIVVESKDGAKVLSFFEVWPEQPQDRRRRGRPSRRIFAGEEKISSAILALTQKQKAAVFFVRWDGPPAIGFRGQFSAVAERLREANFEVRDWDIQRDKEPPTVENMSRAIWVIVPPQPPPPRPDMPFARPPQITSQQKRKIESFLDAGGRALFMMAPANAMLGPPSPFVDKLKEYGIKVDPEVVGIWGLPAADGTVRPLAQVLVRQYEDHPIARELGAYQAVLVRPVAMEPVEAKDASSAVLVRIPNTPDYWGEKNYMAGSMGRTWTKDPGDLPGGFAIAMAGQKGDSKVVVVGDYIWATNEATTARAGFLGLGGLRFPGNVLLFENAIFWLNDNEQMIAVPPQALRVARIAAMGDAARWWWRLVAMVGLPVACLLAGGVVYLFRRS